MSDVTAKLSIEIAHDTMQKLRIKAGRSNISLPGLINKMVDQFLHSETPTAQDFLPLINNIISEIEKHYRQVNIRLDRHSESLGKLWDDVAVIKSTKVLVNHPHSLTKQIPKELPENDLLGQVYGADVWSEYFGNSPKGMANKASASRARGSVAFDHDGRRFLIVGKGKFQLIETKNQPTLFDLIS